MSDLSQEEFNSLHGHKAEAKAPDAKNKIKQIFLERRVKVKSPGPLDPAINLTNLFLTI